MDLSSPLRRSAYDSNALRIARRSLALLHRLCSLLPVPLTVTVGSWPRHWVQLLDQLAKAGHCLPRDTVGALRAAVLAALSAQKALVAQLTRELRKIRHKRWSTLLPTLWQERPGVIYNWLHAVGAPWGTTPILDASGSQCLSVSEVDVTVRQYWVEGILRCHASVDSTARWQLFFSQFGAHIPVLEWPTPSWSADRVRRILGCMREKAAPGSLGIPLAIWKALPVLWHGVIARLLSLVESDGRWPSEWLDAYVSMIPKSSGGTRPQDQRPITVLDLLYRVWAKGVVLAWTPVLQVIFGPSCLGLSGRRRHHPRRPAVVRPHGLTAPAAGPTVAGQF